MRPIFTVHSQSLKDNYRHLCAQAAPGCTVGAVVKADAYGLGMARVAPFLAQAGCQSFFVAHFEEAQVLRALLPEAEIFVFHGLCGADPKDFWALNLIPVVNHFEDLKILSDSGENPDCALHIDTGMNRLGFVEADLAHLQSDPSFLCNVRVQMIMSHFSSAEENEALTRTQYNALQAAVKYFPDVRVSLANSSGFFADLAYHFDLTRPGATLYGLNPTPDQPNPMKQVVELQAPVLQVKIAKSGTCVGYGATDRFEQDTPVATLGIGYAHGLFRTLGNKGCTYWKGIKCPIRGRVSMDLITVDLSEVPEREYPVPGDQFEILGVHQDADALAADAGTIGYEILTNLGARCARNYI